MHRFLFLLLLVVGAGWHQPATAQAPAAGLPARPVPFTFVTDQGHLLAPAEARKLENGLRSYAQKTGTQVVVVTVPSLGGRPVADYGRALGTAWGVGQRDKNNGLVVLIGAQEHKVTVQPGSGLASIITPAVVSRVINQEMTPAFKQGNYFQGLRDGLNTLMVTANPSSDPRKNKPAAGPASAGAAAAATSGELTDNTSRTASAMQPQPSGPAGAQQSEVTAPAPSGPGLGTLLMGALLIGGLLWLVMRLFRGRSAAATTNGSPNFYPGNAPRPNQPNQPNQPNFYPSQGGNPGPGYGGGYPNQGNSGGMGGMGGILATGAAAAAGAYLGNRLGGSHDSGASAPQHFDSGSVGNAGAVGAAGTGAAGDYFSGRDGGSSNDDSFTGNNDYFSGNDAASSDSSGDYFSSDSSSYDDTSSDDTGGGGFDSTDDNSGSW